MSLNCYVSFARTPLTEIGEKVEQIKTLGWNEDGGYGRGDPWVAAFQRDVDESDPDPTRELREVMGDYWLDSAAMKALLASKS
jgi:hypothetical protein